MKASLLPYPVNAALQVAAAKTNSSFTFICFNGLPVGEPRGRSILKAAEVAFLERRAGSDPTAQDALQGMLESPVKYRQ